MEKKLEDLEKIKKKKSKISNTDVELGAKTIFSIYSENKNIEEVVTLLTSMYYKISAVFVKKYFPGFKKEDREEFFKLITNCDIFKKPNSNIYNSLGFEIIKNGISNNVIKPYCVSLLVIIANLSHKKNEFTPTSKANLNELLDKNYEMFFELDFSTCSHDDRKLILNYILESTPSLFDCKYLEKLKEWAKKYNFELGKIEEGKEDKNEDKKEDVNSIAEDNGVRVKIEKGKGIIVNEEVIDITTNMDENIQKTVELLGLLATASGEVEKLIKNVSTKNISIEVLEKIVKEKDEEIQSLKNELREGENKISSLSFKVERFEGRLSEKQSEIDDLTERLKKSFDSDEFTKNQELVTLKKNITNSLKLQYSDYCDLKESVCREDEFEVLKVILGQVFRILSKYGIDF